MIELYSSTAYAHTRLLPEIIKQYYILTIGLLASLELDGSSDELAFKDIRSGIHAQYILL